MNYQDRIPNNVDLGSNRTLQRALEHWQPEFLNWWQELGPRDFQVADVYLRTATSVDAKGWATYGFVRMPEYRWGIFLADAIPTARSASATAIGQEVWQQIPGEYRSTLRRLIVTQGDTEPASVEQQRMLGHTAPSLYDLRNLFQVNVEEGRHLWAMVYLLHAYFGRDGREEAEELLERHSGDADKPRILGTFNEPIRDWLSFFMFTYFTDRDGKFQLKSLAESSFDPLARTCQFMLTEEAHHMFVGDTGISRVIKRTLEVMKELGTRRSRWRCARPARSILPTDAEVSEFLVQLVARSVRLGDLVQRGLVFRERTEGASGRGALRRPHCRRSDRTRWKFPMASGGVRTEQIPMRNAMNEVTRGSYVKDCEIGVTRWNRLIEKAGYSLPPGAAQHALPPQHRHLGRRADRSHGQADHAGRIQRAQIASWLPSDGDRAYILSLMHGVSRAGKMAAWIAPPDRGINSNPVDYEYVKLH